MAQELAEEGEAQRGGAHDLCRLVAYLVPDLPQVVVLAERYRAAVLGREYRVHVRCEAVALRADRYARREEAESRRQHGGAGERRAWHDASVELRQQRVPRGESDSGGHDAPDRGRRDGERRDAARGVVYDAHADRQPEEVRERLREDVVPAARRGIAHDGEELLAVAVEVREVYSADVLALRPGVDGPYLRKVLRVQNPREVPADGSVGAREVVHPGEGVALVEEDPELELDAREALREDVDCLARRARLVGVEQVEHHVAQLREDAHHALEVVGAVHGVLCGVDHSGGVDERDGLPLLCL